MLHISNLILVGLILFNLIGLAVALTPWFRSYLLAKLGGVLLVTLVVFALEHIIGLGRLSGLWPLTTAGAAWLIFRRPQILKQGWRTELVFTLGFLYALSWRYSEPDIDSQSERMTNLLYISNYINGNTLPPVDNWLPPYKFNFYYAFQHYGAALQGRIFGLDAGTAYNYGYCTLSALIITGAIGAAYRFADGRFRALWTGIVFVIGGTGVSLLLHFMVPAGTGINAIWPPVGLPASMRFIGDSALDKNMGTQFGHWVASFKADVPEPVEIPMETPSYLLSLGDHHAPLSGFFLLVLALLCIAGMERNREPLWSAFFLGLSVPVTMIANAWSFPFQAGLLMAYGTYRVFVLVFTRSRNDNFPSEDLIWKYMGAGLAAGLVLSYPSLRELSVQARDYDIHMRFIQPGEHTPLLQGLLVWWPAVVILLLGSLNRRAGTLGWFLILFWLLLFGFTETFFMDEIYSGKFNRFNSTLKWWPWIYGGVFLTVGSLNLLSTSRVIRWGTIVTCFIVCLYGLDLGNGLRLTPRKNMGLMNGDAWLSYDPVQKALLDYLKAAPRAPVLENVRAGAYTPGSAYALFSNQPCVIGWSAHEGLWRGYRQDIKRRGDEVKQFYAGSIPEPDRWLRDQNAQYILWLKEDNTGADGKNPWSTINDQISDRYMWQEFYGADNFHVGVWTRRTTE